MGSPETGPQSLENRENDGGFLIEFPDGTTGKYKSRDEAIEAMQEWREAA